MSLTGSIFLPLITLGKTLADLYPSNFIKTMSHEKKFDSSLLKTNHSWQLAKRLFDEGMHVPYTTTNRPKIPHKIHLIWLGGPPPHYYLALAKKLERLHPSFIVKIWTNEDAKVYDMQRRQAFNRAQTYGEKSDIFRYEILYNEGGIYLDGDFEIYHPLTELTYACDFFTGIAHVSKNFECNNALIGTVPEHPIIKECLDTITSGKEAGLMATINRTGPRHFTRCFLQKARAADSVIIPFPVTFFYPFPNYRRKSPETLSTYIKPHSIAAHLWKVSWLKPKKNSAYKQKYRSSIFKKIFRHLWALH